MNELKHWYCDRYSLCIGWGRGTGGGTGGDGGGRRGGSTESWNWIPIFSLLSTDNYRMAQMLVMWTWGYVNMRLKLQTYVTLRKTRGKSYDWVKDKASTIQGKEEEEKSYQSSVWSGWYKIRSCIKHNFKKRKRDWIRCPLNSLVSWERGRFKRSWTAEVPQTHAGQSVSLLMKQSTALHR